MSKKRPARSKAATMRPAGVPGNVWTEFLQARDSNEAFGLTIEGDAMLPDFTTGDHVIIDPQVQPEPGDFVAAIVPPGMGSFLKYQPMQVGGEARIGLLPLNPVYLPFILPSSKVQIIGTMIEHRRYRRAA